MSIEIVVADDLVAPALSGPAGVGTGETTANLAASTDKDNGSIYWVVTESASSPSSTQVQAGEDHLGGAAVANGSQSVTALGEQNAAATGLSTATTYYAHFTQVDVSANISDVASSPSFDTTADAIAPVLSGASASATSASSLSALVTTDEGNGTLYGVVTSSASVPSQAQVKAGQDHTGSAADWAGSEAVFSSGEKSLTPTGLTAATNYYFHTMHEDATGNQSAVTSSASVTTWPAIPSAETFDASGTWTVPAAADYYTVTVKVYGGGGGGGGGGISSSTVAGDGGESKFDVSTPLVAGGGKGGQGRYYGGGGGGGAAGTASGGATNTAGEAGAIGTLTGDPSSGQAIGGKGGDCPNGGAGGAQSGPSSTAVYGTAGTAPGGAGSGGLATGPGGGGGGGSGGYVSQSYAPETFTVSGSVTVTVGAGGAAGYGWRTGGVGAGGRVTVEYA